MRALKIFATRQLAALFGVLLLSVVFARLGLDALSLICFFLFVSAGFLDFCKEVGQSAVKSVRSRRGR